MPNVIHASRVQSRQDLSVSRFSTPAARCSTNFTMPVGITFLQSANPGLAALFAAWRVESALPFSRHYRLICPGIASTRRRNVAVKCRDGCCVLKLPKPVPLTFLLCFWSVYGKVPWASKPGSKRLQGGNAPETPFEIRRRA